MLIRERLERCDFSHSERVIIDFILKEKMKIKDMTTKDIANATYTSPSTLIRIAHNMSRIQKKVTICHLQGELVYSAMNAEPQSCAIIVSYSGETPILSRVIQALKANGIPIIALTNIGENTVSKHADVVLRICTREKLYSKIATFSTDISFEYILDLLYSCIFALNYDQNVERKTKISSMIEKGRFSTIDIMKEDEF
ncbi:SIS domain-containing protein [Massilimicrobiota sp. An80]|uniref:MurR/RpiR family transcriptional regulator n=1 Tax=Massilimicrobiota sp. An80 TaxID=1965658 RepID=UPI000B43A86D|nr:SIS domain-containing protein [Massilimicrobiota sp. An80]OUN37040.1 hypothetical protein B5G32_05480 [Massilimicrobiota sp. An80]